MGQELEHEGAGLAHIHRDGNEKKAETYWLGFLQGVLASTAVEGFELPALRAEAHRFLELFGDVDAADLIRDLDTGYAEMEREIRDIVECIVDIRLRGLTIETRKDWINHFYGFLAGIACDNLITVEEVDRLLQCLAEAPFPIEDSRILSLQKVARRAIADGRITPEESDDICGWIARLVGDSCADTGLATYGNAAVLGDCLSEPSMIVFEGAAFVVTGKFRIAPRKVLTALIEERGGTVARGVTARTDYLVVAAECSRDWIHSHEGTKLVTARELRAKGGRPELVDEVTFKLALGDVL